MPWSVKKSNECPPSKPHAVVKEGGKVVGCHATRAGALRQQAALYANEGSSVEAAKALNEAQGLERG